MVTWIESLPGGEEEMSGSSMEFLSALRQLQPGGRLPPLAVVQDLIARGGFDAGMSGGMFWNSDDVEVDETAYNEMDAAQRDAKSAPRAGLRTYEEWRAWCAEQDLGVPYAEHLQWLNKLRTFSAVDREDEDGSVLKRAELIREYLAFMSKHSGGTQTS